MTNSLTRRLKEHNKGESSTPSTKFRGPFEIVYWEETRDRKAARKKEKYLKSGVGRDFIKRYLKKYNPR